MAAQADKPGGPIPKTSNPPYPFRAGWLLFLLAVNFLVAAMYFHVINP